MAVQPGVGHSGFYHDEFVECRRPDGDFLAGLQGIPQHLYEAAEIDGATTLERFFNVTIPMMSRIILPSDA